MQKAGTTRWWKLIVKHPQVVGWQLKETHQLSRFGWRPLFDADRETYYRYFPRPEGKLVGEWTPRYMNVPGVVEPMKTLAPEAKLLVLLRDPVERYRSGVGQWQKHKERRGKRLNLWAGRKDAYARSFYGFALRPYVEAFGLERMLILQFEKCLQDPAGEYQRTLEFLEPARPGFRRPRSWARPTTSRPGGPPLPRSMSRPTWSSRSRATSESCSPSPRTSTSRSGPTSDTSHASRDTKNDGPSGKDGPSPASAAARSRSGLRGDLDERAAAGAHDGVRWTT